MAKKKTVSKQTEKEIPDLAMAATQSAYRRAVRLGDVLVYRNGELRRVEAGGKSHTIKKLESRTRIPKGSKFEIKPEPA